MSEPTRFLIVNSHPIQYFAPLYRNMAATPSFDVTVLYCSRHGLGGELDRQFGTTVQWDVPLLEGYRHVFLSNQSPRPSIYGFWGLLNLSVIVQLWRAERSVVVVYGWAYAVCWITIFFARLFGHTVCLRAESPLNLERYKSPNQQRLRRWVLGRGLFRLVNRFLYLGAQNKAFYQHFGVADNQLIFGPYSVDNTRFQQQAALLRSDRDRIRQQLGILPNECVLLYSGKYVPKKRPLDLLRAVQRLARPNIMVVLMGDGELRPELTAFIQEHAMPSVLLTGFVNQSSIGMYYTAADVFVMCSNEAETWGLSTNEAMNFNLPVVLSDAIGCADDLVQPGKNGYRYPCGNIEELARALARVVDCPADERRRMGEASRERVSHYSYGQTIDNLRIAFSPISI